MKSLIPTLTLTIFLLSTSSLQAAEFAYHYAAGVMNSKAAGNGSYFMGGYGGFGLSGSIEYKAYQDKNLLAAYVGFRTPLIAELGVTPEGLSARGGVSFPIIQNMDFFDSSTLFFIASYEKFFSNCVFKL